MLLALLALVAALQTPDTTRLDQSTTKGTIVTVGDAAVDRLARKQFTAWAGGKLDAGDYSVAISGSAIEEVRQALSRMGEIQSEALLQSIVTPDGTIYVYKFRCLRGVMIEQMSLKGGKINGIYFRPGQ